MKKEKWILIFSLGDGDFSPGNDAAGLVNQV
jgi:hypothetical protein